MSWSWFSHRWIRMGLIGPWSPPAKKAIIGRWEGDGPPRNPVKWPVCRLISGNDTSFDGLNPSEVFALQSTRIEFLYRLGTDFDASGPWKLNSNQSFESGFEIVINFERSKPFAQSHSLGKINNMKRTPSDGNVIVKSWTMWITYPIMAGEHEMISTEWTIPKRVFGSNDIDVINDSVSYWSEVMWVMNIDEPNEHGNT